MKKQQHLKKFKADLISPQEAALWKREASNAGYHYLGCAKTFALIRERKMETTEITKKHENPVDCGHWFAHLQGWGVHRPNSLVFLRDLVPFVVFIAEYRLMGKVFVEAPLNMSK